MTEPSFINSEAGILYIVATPIGNLSDMTERAIETLRHVGLILAEDTRHTKPLLQHFAINTRAQAFHDHNEREQVSKIIKRLEEGQNIALVSDAGTPLISDPGYGLVKAAQEAHIQVCPIPGACAVIAALSASGMPTDQFLFAGFIPAKMQQRLNFLQSYTKQSSTLVFYESSHRIQDSLRDCAEVFGDRRATLARELTKKFETIRSATFHELQQWVAEDENQRKGEFVLMVEGVDKNQDEDQQHLDHLLSVLLEDLPLSKAVELSVKLSGIKKNKVYKRALELQKSDSI